MNISLRKRSGEITRQGALIGFLYELMRDHLPPGVVEELVRANEEIEQPIQFTNGWLALYAEDLAKRLTE